MVFVIDLFLTIYLRCNETRGFTEIQINTTVDDRDLNNFNMTIYMIAYINFIPHFTFTNDEWEQNTVRLS